MSKTLSSTYWSVSKPSTWTKKHPSAFNFYQKHLCFLHPPWRFCVMPKALSNISIIQLTRIIQEATKWCVRHQVEGQRLYWKHQEGVINTNINEYLWTSEYYMMHLMGRNFEPSLVPCHHSNSILASPSQPDILQKQE